MEKILGVVFGSLLLVGLNSCISNPEATQADYDRGTPESLCMHYLTTDALNIYRPYSRRAIVKRNIDCTPYVAMARLSYERERAMWNDLYGAVGSLSNTGTTTQSNSSNSFKRQEVNGQTKICYYQTLGGVKAYNTTATTLCPMSYPY